MIRQLKGVIFRDQAPGINKLLAAERAKPKHVHEFDSEFFFCYDDTVKCAVVACECGVFRMYRMGQA